MRFVTPDDLMELLTIADQEEVDRTLLVDRLITLCDTPVNTGAIIMGLANATAEMMRSHHLVPATMPPGGFAALRVLRVSNGEATPVDDSQRIPAVSASQILIAALNSDKPMALALTKALVLGDVDYALETIVASLAMFRDLHGTSCRNHE